jgi:anti-sigma factor RsiW
MLDQNFTTKDCLCTEVSAFLDGELSVRDEQNFELHLSNCEQCKAELLTQKQMLCALSLAFDSPKHEFELPKNFTKTIVTKAESNVSGLRNPKERSRAFILCLILFAFVIIALGESFGKFLSVWQTITEQVVAVIGFTADFAVDVFTGLAVVLRALGQKFVFDSQVSTLVFLVFFLIVFTIFSNILIRHHRNN